MPIAQNEWYEIKHQSLALYASRAGFNLAYYDDYHSDVRGHLKSKAIRTAMNEISNEFRNLTGEELSEIRRGLYVISISDPLSVKYSKGRSNVIYIGIGSIHGRIRSHFEGMLFELMLSLRGVNFDFRIAVPSYGEENDHHRHVEYLMLEYFRTKFCGGTKGKDGLPLLNANAGSNKNQGDAGNWWKRPLRNNGRTPKWTLSPTEFSKFGSLD